MTTTSPLTGFYSTAGWVARLRMRQYARELLADRGSPWSRSVALARFWQGFAELTNA